MSENTETRYEKIISSIVGVTAYQIEGVASLSSDTDNKLTGRLFRSSGKGVLVDMLGGNKVNIDIFVNIYYGYKIPDLAYELQSKIISEVEKSTAYKVSAVNVNVVGVVFKA